MIMAGNSCRFYHKYEQLSHVLTKLDFTGAAEAETAWLDDHDDRVWRGKNFSGLLLKNDSRSRQNKIG